MSRNCLVGATVLASIFMTATAQAQSVPMQWSGFYVGGNIGATIGDGSYKAQPGGCALSSPPCLPFVAQRVVTGDFDDANFTGGGQLGYNLQFSRWLIGVETDFNFTDSDQTDKVDRTLVPPSVTGTLNTSVSSSIDWFGTVRGRVGVLATPTLLLFATGGFAYGDTNSASRVRFSAGGDVYRGSVSETSTGWTVGGGGELAFGGNWTAKLEYLFVDLGDEKYFDACVRPATTCASNNAFNPPLGYQTEIDFREHVVRVGLNYRFGSAPAPVDAPPLK